MMVLSRIAATLSSPLPAGDRSTRIVRCAAGEGTIRESEHVEGAPHPKPALRSGFDLSPAGRGKVSAMLFSSYAFLFQFLPVVALAFAVARRVSPRCGIWALAFASLIFYGAWKPIYLLLLIASIGFNFWLGLKMEDPLRRRGIGTLGVTLNLVFVLLEGFYGLVAHSLALLADAGHNLSDVLGLLCTLLVPLQLALIVIAMQGFRQAWNVEVEREPSPAAA